MQEWWNEIVRWFNSDDGWIIVTGAIVPFAAILAGGIIAGLIARGSIKRLLAQQDRNQVSAAIASLIAAGRRAAQWNSLSAREQDLVDYQVGESAVRLRLLPVAGAGVAADWADHHITTMMKKSSAYSIQAQQDLRELQDGLLNWQTKPSRTRKVFLQDLAVWNYDDTSAEDELVAKQREWAAQQSAGTAATTAQTAVITPGATDRG